MERVGEVTRVCGLFKEWKFARPRSQRHAGKMKLCYICGGREGREAPSPFSHGEYKGTVKNERSSPGRGEGGEGPMETETKMTSAKVEGLTNLTY